MGIPTTGPWLTQHDPATQVPRPGSFTPEPQRAARLPRAAATEAPELRGVAPQLGTPTTG